MQLIRCSVTENYALLPEKHYRHGPGGIDFWMKTLEEGEDRLVKLLLLILAPDLGNVAVRADQPNVWIWPSVFGDWMGATVQKMAALPDDRRPGSFHFLRVIDNDCPISGRKDFQIYSTHELDSLVQFLNWPRPNVLKIDADFRDSGQQYPSPMAKLKPRSCELENLDLRNFKLPPDDSVSICRAMQGLQSFAVKCKAYENYLEDMLETSRNTLERIEITGI